MKSVKALLENLIDYAGLFPPASLDMAAVVRNYARYHEGEWAWVLGRLIVPVARLGEFESAAHDYAPRAGGGPTWRLSALAGTDLRADLVKIGEFNQRFAQRVAVDALEIKVEHGDQIGRAAASIPSALTPYFEIPIDGDPADLVAAIAGAGARAKVRTGGVTAGGFPSALNLARFLAACAGEDVAFKATAGLHHPLRSVNRLTDEPESETALMHGFLNLFLASVFAYNGMSVEQLAEIIEERSPGAFRFENDSVFWRDQMLVISHLRNARRLFAIAFGSCSFEEPIEDLKKIGLI